MKTRLFAHDRRDALLVMVALGQFALLLFGVLSFGAAPWWASLLVGLLCAFSICMSFIVIGHYFLHNPFFTSKRLNALFGMFNSMLLGTPQTFHRLHHLQHHRYNNDAPDPRTGTTGDFSSTWRYSKRAGREENFFRYALLAYFRSDLGYLFREMRRLRLGRQVAAEAGALVLMLAAFAVLNPLGLAAFYLPVWLLGNMATHAQNYLEHHHAIPGDRRTDSVSSYGRLYNLIWFNNGYHQEHHYRPQVHWTRLPEITPLLPPPSQRRVVRWAHWFNFDFRDLK